jgi:hypothetical protein
MPGPLMNKNIKGGRMLKNEQTYLKITLMLIRDWDGFQAAMRRALLKTKRDNENRRKEYT